MKYLYKKTGAVVESGIRLNPAIFKPIVEEDKNIPAKEDAAAVTEEVPAEGSKAEEATAESISAAAAKPVSSVKTTAKASTAQKKTTVSKTTSTKK